MREQIQTAQILLFSKPPVLIFLLASRRLPHHNPLVRLDVGRLLGKYVGESEENIRKSLKLSEAISPCVLWIDEIEKAFAGVGGNGEENDISRMPPEFLRKERFDELFFVDLANGEERRKMKPMDLMELIEKLA